MLERAGILALICDWIEQNSPWEASWSYGGYMGEEIHVYGVERSSYEHFLDVSREAYKMLEQMGLGAAMVISTRRHKSGKS